MKDFMTYGKVTSVYDGDTCHMNIINNEGKIKTYICRLYGYDSEEIK